MDIGPTSYDMILRMLVENEIHFGKIAKYECTRAALHGLCVVCFGGILVGRTRAHFEYKEQLENAGITGKFWKVCLFCQVSRKVCVLESEWQFLLFCPNYVRLRSEHGEYRDRYLRSARLRNMESTTSVQNMRTHSSRVLPL